MLVLDIIHMGVKSKYSPGGCWDGGGAEVTGSSTDAGAAQAERVMGKCLSLNKRPYGGGGGVYYR